MMELRPSALPTSTAPRKSIISQQQNNASLPPPPPPIHTPPVAPSQNSSFMNQTMNQQSFTQLITYQNVSVTY